MISNISCIYVIIAYHPICYPLSDTHCTPRRQLVLRMAVTPKFLRKCGLSSPIAFLGLVNRRQAEKVKCLHRTRKTPTLAELLMFYVGKYVDLVNSLHILILFLKEFNWLIRWQKA